MFFKIKNKLDSLLSGTMSRIIVVLIIPVLFISIFSALTGKYFFDTYKDAVASNYSIRLASFAVETNAKISTLTHIAELTSSNPDIRKLISSPPELYNNQSDEMQSGIDAILSAEKVSDITESIAVYSKTNASVLTKTGIYDENKYFTSIYSYEKYPLSFWQEYRFPDEMLNQLEPTEYVNSIFSAQGSAVPIVYLPEKSPDIVIIININADKLYSYFEDLDLKSAPSANPRIYIYNNISPEIYGKYIDKDSEISSLTEKAKNITNSIYDTAYINGKKYMIMGSDKHFGTPEYSYILAVPYWIINNAVSPIITYILLLNAILLLLLILSIIWGAKTLYYPWKNLAETVDILHPFDKNASPGKIEDYLISSFSNILDINKELEQNLSVTLPLSQEKYLIDILNNDTSSGNNEEFLAPLKFKYDYFISLAIEISINPAFFSTTSITASQMHRDMCQAIRALFSNHFVTYELPSVNNVLYLLLNLENDTCMDTIYETIKKVNDVFALETDNVDFIFGIGNIYSGFDGLKLTHKEAISNMSKKINSRKIKLSSSAAGYSFNESSENILVNYLNAAYIDKAQNFLKNILHDISTESFDKRREVYNDIITALQRYETQKGIAFKLFPPAGVDLSNVPENDIREYILSAPENIVNNSNSVAPKINIAEIVDYINEHFTEDMYLEKLAEIYNTSTKYLSKRIKQYLDMPFKDYLTQLRIDKAKELLENDDVKISELYSLVGFQNRSVFIRAFKLKVGLTPSEYKKTYKK